MKLLLSVFFFGLTFENVCQGLKCVCSEDFIAEKSQQQTDYKEKVERITQLARNGNCSIVGALLEKEKQYFEQAIGLNFSTIAVNVTADNSSICDNVEYTKIIRAMHDFYRLLASCDNGECDVEKSCSDSLVCQQYARDSYDVQRCFHNFANGKDFRGCQIGSLPETDCLEGSTEASFDYTCDYDYCNKENQYERYCLVEPALRQTGGANLNATDIIASNDTFAV